MNAILCRLSNAVFCLDTNAYIFSKYIRCKDCLEILCSAAAFLVYFTGLLSDNSLTTSTSLYGVRALQWRSRVGGPWSALPPKLYSSFYLFSVNTIFVLDNHLITMLIYRVFLDNCEQLQEIIPWVKTRKNSRSENIIRLGQMKIRFFQSGQQPGKPRIMCKFYNREKTWNYAWIC